MGAGMSTIMSLSMSTAAERSGGECAGATVTRAAAATAAAMVITAGTAITAATAAIPTA